LSKKIKADEQYPVNFFYKKNAYPAEAGQAGEPLPPQQSENEELGQSLNAPRVHCHQAVR